MGAQSNPPQQQQHVQQQQVQQLQQQHHSQQPPGYQPQAGMPAYNYYNPYYPSYPYYSQTPMGVQPQPYFAQGRGGFQGGRGPTGYSDVYTNIYQQQPQQQQQPPSSSSSSSSSNNNRSFNRISRHSSQAAAIFHPTSSLVSSIYRIRAKAS